MNKWSTISHGTSQQALLAMQQTTENNNIAKFVVPQNVSSQPPATLDNLQVNSNTSSKDPKETTKDLPTPTSTPTTSRKSRRRSNLFIPSSKKSDDKMKNGELGSGRAIPLKQGYLYKRSSKSLNKEWKKKYVTLCDDGRLTYHPSLHDYMDDVHGKEVSLQYVTVKVPGQKPRGSKSIITNSALTQNTKNILSDQISGLSLLKDSNSKKTNATEKVLLTAFDTLREPIPTSGNNLATTKSHNSQTSGDEGIVLSNSNSQSFINQTGIGSGGGNAGSGSGLDNNNKVIDAQTPNVKKRHRRMKSSGVKNNEYDGKFVCLIVLVNGLEINLFHFSSLQIQMVLNSILYH